MTPRRKRRMPARFAVNRALNVADLARLDARPDPPDDFGGPDFDTRDREGRDDLAARPVVHNHDPGHICYTDPCPYHMTDRDKIAALIDFGLADDLDDARSQLEDMGELDELDDADDDLAESYHSDGFGNVQFLHSYPIA